MNKNKSREYNKWVANESLEDYSLRYAPRSFRKWSDMGRYDFSRNEKID